MAGNLIRQNKIQDGIDDTLLAEVNSSRELKVKDTSADSKILDNKDLLIEAVTLLRKIEYHLSIGTDINLKEGGI